MTGFRKCRTAAGRRLISAWLVTVLMPAALSAAYAQVDPAEITNPRLKPLESAYLPQLVAVGRAIAEIKFPFVLFVSRYVGLDPQKQAGADARGLEFVLFQDRTVLKTSGNYNAAFDAALLTRNQRAGRVFEEVVTPILRLLPEYFSTRDNFDRFGFEISYHVRARSSSHDYEGKEILAVVMDKSDALAYANAPTESGRQNLLNGSEIYVNGEAFGLALHAAREFGADELATLRQSHMAREKAEPGPVAKREPVRADSGPGPVSGKPAGQPPGPRGADAIAGGAPAGAPPSAAKGAGIEALQNRLQPQLDALGAEGVARYHFVDYALPSLVIFRDRIHLQITLRNPNSFDKNTTSIYKRAAQSFDLFLAPLLKTLLARAPAAEEIAGFDITVLHEFGANSKDSPEALEFIFPLASLRKFTDADITNQDLIDQGIVLVNGVRIALDLQRVE